MIELVQYFLAGFDEVLNAGEMALCYQALGIILPVIVTVAVVGAVLWMFGGVFKR